MGIPIYYRKIIENHPECIYEVLDYEVDEFLIDFNAFIYNVLPKIDQTLSPKDFEQQIITETVKQLICFIHIIKPTKLIYIAMDGPPPKAKMIQQRSRRFKSLKEIEFIKELEKKYKIKIPRSKWNKNAISPGTIFMSKLSSEIIRSVKNLHVKVIFSSDLVPGEGEHKLMNHITTSKHNHKTIIYSPDADMIVLSILNKKSNIHILRTDELDHISYLNIDILKNIIESSFSKDKDVYRILKDYSFLTFLCGNDFVHSVPFLKIKDNGINELIKIYTEIDNDTYLLDEKNKINNMFLLKIIKSLSIKENNTLKYIQKKRHHVMKKNPSLLKDSETDKEPWRVEFNRFQHEEYYSPLHPKYNPEIFNKINYYDTNWVEQYNNYFFENSQNVCEEYYKSLEFCTEYYFNNNISWNYFYKYRTSPTMKDFYKFLESNINIRTSWDTGKPFKPFEQLMMILPNSSHGLLPKCLRSSEPDKKFDLDIMCGTKFIYSEAILPNIDDEHIIKLINSCNFSTSEIKRNTIKENPFTYRV